LAIITQLIKSISHFGHITVNLSLLFKSPDNLTGTLIHNLNQSDLMISSCVCFLNGNNTLTFLISDFSDFIVTVSSQANCPGCEISLSFLNA
jgi:hypothetical protein